MGDFIASYRSPNDVKVLAVFHKQKLCPLQIMQVSWKLGLLKPEGLAQQPRNWGLGAPIAQMGSLRLGEEGPRLPGAPCVLGTPGYRHVSLFDEVRTPVLVLGTRISILRLGQHFPTSALLTFWGQIILCGGGLSCAILPLAVKL